MDFPVGCFYLPAKKSPAGNPAGVTVFACRLTPLYRSTRSGAGCPCTRSRTSAKKTGRFSWATADGSALSGRLAAMVEHAKTNARIATKFPAQWRQQFMTWEDEMKLQVKERAEVLAQELAEEAAVETARKLLGKNVAMEIISEATGLPLAQVEQLR